MTHAELQQAQAQAQALALARAIESLPYLCTREQMLVLARAVLALAAEREAMGRELERWRHGVTIEGDFVCPHALERDAMAKVIEAACEWREYAHGQYKFTVCRDLAATIDTYRAQATEGK